MPIMIVATPEILPSELICQPECAAPDFARYHADIALIGSKVHCLSTSNVACKLNMEHRPSGLVLPPTPKYARELRDEVARAFYSSAIPLNIRDVFVAVNCLRSESIMELAERVHSNHGASL
jgi:hypothetical protein